MWKSHNKKILLFLSFLIAISLIFTSSNMLAEKDDSTSEIQQKLDSISHEEREILEFLFLQVQEIEEMERESIRINEEIHIMTKEIDGLEENILKEETKYDENLNALESILKSYQRMGPASFLEIILDSDNLNSLIRRINLIRDLTRNTGNLLEDTEEAKERLLGEKLNLDQKLELLEERQKALEESLEQKQKLVAEKEAYLESLAGDKDLYMQRLEYVAMLMEEIKQILADFTKEFSRIIQDGNLPMDAVKETITLRGVKGTIDEKTFNDIIASYKSLPYMEIRFKDGEIELNAPDKKLSLAGQFNIVDGQTLQFEAERGSFYDMPLEKGTIEELFKEGYFILNLEPLIGGNIIKSVEIKKGYLELLVSIKIF
ncbi:MAG: hypothetical protein RIN63_03155 [Tissierella sp.]|nr:hypothetical protein [Tissierella sp.]